jgi:N6-L-threonylcarbamoyladenine synthase
VVRSSVVASQADLHARYGGVVPEIASRAHVELICDVVEEALVEAGVVLDDLDAVAAVRGPGLAGALLVGVSAAKAISIAKDLPYVGVHHHEAHLYAAMIEDPQLEPPLVTLVVSGGHTLLIAMDGHGRYRVLGETVDDAAGEAFDKVARFLGLGYPGGPAIDRLAREGDPEAIRFPRPMRNEGLDFSFSGLKTALLYKVRDLSEQELEARRADLAASYQRAIVRALVGRLEAAGGERIAVVGGVAANSELRATLPDAALAPLALCTDNAAMIASAGRFADPVPYPDYLSLDAHATA